MSAKNRKGEAFGGDAESYATPPWVTRLLCNHGPLPIRGQWLDAGAGRAPFAKVFPEQISWTLVEKNEIEGLDDPPGSQRCVGDFAEWAAGRAAVHFGQGVRAWPYDVAISNPPFSLAVPFVAHMRKLAPLVAVLLPLPWLGGEDRDLFFEEAPPSTLLVIPHRIQFVDPTKPITCPRCLGTGEAPMASTRRVCDRCGGEKTVKASSPAVDHAWWIWDAHHCGRTVIERLPLVSKEERQWWRA